MSFHRVSRIALTAFSAALCCIAPAMAAEAPAPTASAAVPQKLRIADERPVDIKIGAPVRGLAPKVYEIRTPDAAFVKVHFDYFNLPAGLTLEVSSPDGSEVYRYSNAHRDGHTVDRKLGQDGVHSFSSMSISGPVARMRLVGTATERWNAGHGVTISRYMEGFPEDLLPAMQSEGLLTGGVTPTAICGVNDKKAVACYESSDATAFDRSRPIAKLVLGGGGSCTAWRVGPDNRMFTNNHCFTTTAEVAASEVWFNYQNTTCTGSTVGTITKVAGDVMLKTDATLDYTLYTVKNFANISAFGYLGLDVRVPTTGEEIFIPQHAGGRVKELAVVSDHVGGGRCIIDTATQNGNGTNTDSGYQCDTEPGSSGSPVVARSSNRAIALHHLGGCNNSGAQISQIWPQVSSHFGGVVPGGDSGGSNVPPTANFSFTTSSLTATFTDGSSDSDGSIASRSWNFGDGTTSTATSPSKTYAAAGTYNVTLTVTDNIGATNSISKSVTVGTSSTVLVNGVPKTGLAASTGASLNFTMPIPADAGATGLKFEMTGGTGDADMYVKYGSAPTDTVYDCRPYKSGNVESCPMATTQAGTYYVRVKAYSSFSGVSLTGSYTTGPLMQTYTNNTDYTISDNVTVDSPITVSGRSGNAPSNASVSVNIVHTYQGDLKVDLVAPDGSLYNIHNRTGTSTDNVIKTVTFNLSTEALNGTWKLRVNDNAAGDVGYINSWSVTF
jgi:PKD repeat protein